VPAGARFEELRSVAALMPADQAGLLGYARAMIHWRRMHRHCGRCGADTVPGRAGHVLVCTNPACQHEQFPRLDPAIIVLVSDGPRILLGRQASWPPGRYSTIAGFVEPGESLEDAVIREVAEETGVKVDEVRYHSSQPWPFPSSLMLGFTARASTHEVHLADQELEDALVHAGGDRERHAEAPSAAVHLVPIDRILVRRGGGSPAQGFVGSHPLAGAALTVSWLSASCCEPLLLGVAVSRYCESFLRPVACQLRCQCPRRRRQPSPCRTHS